MTILMNGHDFFLLLMYVAVLIFTVHIAVVAYHWLSFGADKRRSWLSISIYTAGGILILAAMAYTITTF